jgi:hypothetical protein
VYHVGQKQLRELPWPNHCLVSRELEELVARDWVRLREDIEDSESVLYISHRRHLYQVTHPVNILNIQVHLSVIGLMAFL